MSLYKPSLHHKSGAIDPCPSVGKFLTPFNTNFHLQLCGPKPIVNGYKTKAKHALSVQYVCMYVCM